MSQTGRKIVYILIPFTEIFAASQTLGKKKKKATMKDGDAEWTEWMFIQIFYLVISRSVVWIVYICFVK